MKEIISELLANKSLFIQLTVAHIIITYTSALIAVVFGILIGTLITVYQKFSGLILSVVNVVYTVPAIAMLGILISFTGIGNTTAVIALIIYALLPVVRSTYTGIMNVPPELVEAAEAMGSTRLQILTKVKLPLAMPVIMSGIRNMVIMTIALAGIASFVGAGGLGVAIYRGITTNNTALMICGSILIALLALISDFILGKIENKLDYRTVKSKKLNWKVFAAISAVILIMFGAFSIQKNNTIKIASKPTTEGYVLGEILKQTIEAKTGFHVDLTQGVGGGTANIQPAMLKGEFDIYPEYTGTGWQVVLKDKSPYSEKKFNELKKMYEKRYGLTWRGMYGFNDTFGLAIRKDLAEKYHIKTYSELAKYSPKFTFGAEYDFFDREDGFKGLTKDYNMKFAKTMDMDNGLKYEAMKKGKLDVMTVFTTDGQLSNPNIILLQDDKKFYPSYMAGNVVSMKALKKYPKLEQALDILNGILSESKMSELNNEVETKGKQPKDVAHDFLVEEGILEAN